MSESAFWQVVRKNLNPYGKLVRIESPITGSGIPDVVYCLKLPTRPASTGFLELKSLNGWPIRAITPLRIPHLTREQVIFSEEWTATGGRADFLLKIGTDYLLLRSATARKILERKLTRSGILAEAIIHGEHSFPTPGILNALVARPSVASP